uniref:Uncharacterized protein n=1 Tax=Leersia perrieri TaxID=77586 RepID=A0A0D9XD09_9ORYZ
MAPAACVLLDRTVFFRDHPLEPEPPVGGRAAAAAAAGVVGSTTAAASSDSDPLRPETREENIGQYLRAMKPDLRVFDPPKAMLSVDTRKTRVISADQENCPETLLRSRFLISFNASHQGSKYHQLMKKVRQHDEIYLS